MSEQALTEFKNVKRTLKYGLIELDEAIQRIEEDQLGKYDDMTMIDSNEKFKNGNQKIAKLTEQKNGAVVKF